MHLWRDIRGQHLRLRLGTCGSDLSQYLQPKYPDFSTLVDSVCARRQKLSHALT